jgi:hypothetical protein
MAFFVLKLNLVLTMFCFTWSACPSGLDPFIDSSLFTSVRLIISSGANVSVFRSKETGRYYLPFAKKAPVSNIQYTNQNVVGLSNVVTCTYSSVDIGWIIFYSAIRIVFSSSSQAWLDASDRLSAEKCSGYSHWWCETYPTDTDGNGHRGIYACGGGDKTARGSIDISGTGFSFATVPGNLNWPFFGTSVTRTSTNVQYSAVGDCASGGVQNQGRVDLVESAMIMPPVLPQFPHAINPSYIFGREQYDWSCLPKFYGPKMTLIKLLNDTWQFMGGPVNCSKCPTGTAVPVLIDYNLPWSCVSCAAGTFSSDGVLCQGCPAGTFSGIGASSCTACPTGTFSRVINGTSNTVCFICPAGSFTDNEGSIGCVLCPSGWSSYPGATACNIFVQASSTCMAGTRGIKILLDGSWTCDYCPPGTFSLANATSCSLCPAGSYGNRAGLTSALCSGSCPNAVDCPAGTAYPPTISLSCASGDARAVPASLSMHLLPAAHPSNNQNVDLIFAPADLCASQVGQSCIGRTSVSVGGVILYVVGTAVDLHMEPAEELTCIAL